MGDIRCPRRVVCHDRVFGRANQIAEATLLFAQCVMGMRT